MRYMCWSNATQRWSKPNDLRQVIHNGLWGGETVAGNAAERCFQWNSNTNVYLLPALLVSVIWAMIPKNKRASYYMPHSHAIFAQKKTTTTTHMDNLRVSDSLVCFHAGFLCVCGKNEFFKFFCYLYQWTECHNESNTSASKGRESANGKEKWPCFNRKMKYLNMVCVEDEKMLQKNDKIWKKKKKKKKGYNGQLSEIERDASMSRSGVSICVNVVNPSWYPRGNKTEWQRIYSCRFAQRLS